MLRFAILKEVGKDEGQVLLEYDENMILSRLQARIKENLAEIETAIKHSFKKPEIAKALDKSFNDLVAEFKEETVKLK